MALVDLHLHSKASTETGNWFLKNALLPESYTNPEDAYQKAKRLGMDFVTLTDHDTIAGALEIAHHPDAFISVEVTTRFPEDGTPLHVLCWNITEADFVAIDAVRADVYALVDLLEQRDITHALAHPLFRIGADLTPSHLERCLLLFPIWEGRNGARSRDGNTTAVRIAESATPEFLNKLAEKHGLTPRRPEQRSLTAGSDDHGLLDAAATYTETPPAASVTELMRHIRMGSTTLRGQHGSTAALSHAMIGLAIKAATERNSCPVPQQLRGLVGDMLEYPLPEDDVQLDDDDELTESGEEQTSGLEDRIRADKDVRRAWRKTYRIPEGPERSHARLKIAATWAQRELLTEVVAPTDGVGGIARMGHSIGLLFGAMTLAAPYLTSAGYHAAEARHARLINSEFFGDDPLSVSPPRALMLTDTFDELNGVAGTMRRLAERAPALDLPMTVVAAGDRAAQKPGLITLKPLITLPVPAYQDENLTLGFPSMIELMDVIEESGAQIIHAASPGPMGLAGMLAARVLGLPFAVTHSTQLARYTLALTGDRLAAEAVRAASTWLYRQADLVFAPTAMIAEGLAHEGIDADKIRIFGRGVDTQRFAPTHHSWFARRTMARDADAVVVLAVARLSEEKGIDRLIDAVNMIARDGHPVRLAIVGDGPARAALAAKLEHSPHRLLGPMTGPRLAAVYASADVFCLPSVSETLGQVALEAQASGLPTVVPRETALAEQVIDGVTGSHAQSASVEDMAAALLPIVTNAELRQKMSDAARAAMVSRPTWDDIFKLLASDYADLQTGADHAPNGRRRSIESGVM